MESKELFDLLKQNNKEPLISNPSKFLLDALAIKNEGSKDDNKLKRIFAFWTIGTVSIYLISIIVIIFANFFVSRPLSDTVLVTLLTTTTVRTCPYSFYLFKASLIATILIKFTEDRKVSS